MPDSQQPLDDKKDTKATTVKGYRVPLLRFQVNDVCCDGAAAVFGAGLNIRQIMVDAVVGVLDALYTPKTAPTNVRSITLILRPMDGVAYTTGSDIDNDHKEIHFSTHYIAGVHQRSDGAQDQEEILGVLRHEMVHCFQYNAWGTANGGLIEGIADWVRYKAGFIPPHWHAGTGDKWDDGYQNTGYFLLWLEQQYGEATVPRINEWMRSRQYSDDMWIDLFNEKPSVLFKRYKNTFEAGDEAQAAEPPVPTGCDAVKPSSPVVPKDDVPDDQSYVEVTKPRVETDDKAHDRTVSFFQISEMRLVSRDRLCKLTYDGTGSLKRFFHTFESLIEVLDPNMPDKERKLLLVTALRGTAVEQLDMLDPDNIMSYKAIKSAWALNSGVR
ncbi:hypothetical protein Dda_7875 [Drechslerella dactyloides]|uniref:Plant basic secretory protein n=1 Tax=Drechslerella dactyloides TaxID=74499 RepID=A0AAD6IV64_DREDA|nr:hypothetical protein Dda_7875 [Drechslerella dactyloides]